MDNDDFDNVTWQTESTPQSPPAQAAEAAGASSSTPDRHGKPSLPAAAATAPLGDPVDLGGIGAGLLECTVDTPLKEGGAAKDAYVSYLVTTHTDFKSFQKPTFSVRRRFTDFVFLYKSLAREYPACAVPPLPEKHKMEYVRGDRFGPDFTQRRAHSLRRFLRRLALHPVLRRSALLVVFLESGDWNAHMRLRPGSASGGGSSGGGGLRSPSNGSGGNGNGDNSVFDNFADTFINAFHKVHKPDPRFVQVRERCDKLDEDLGHVEKVVARVARRQADLEADLADLASQFLKLAVLEPGAERPVHAFARGASDVSAALGRLRAHTDRDYLGSLRDMAAYVGSVRALLRTREQKQLDFEGLSEYLAKAAQDRDQLASTPAGSPANGLLGSGPSGALASPTGFLRSKLEDARGVDPERARRERVRKLELQIERLTVEVEGARRTAELFDDEVVREVADFERARAAEFRDSLGALAGEHVAFFEGVLATWEGYARDMEREEQERAGGEPGGSGGGAEGR